MSTRVRRLPAAAVFAVLLPCAGLAPAPVHGAESAADKASNALAHDIFQQLIEINTTDSVGNVTTASEAMAKRFRDAGFPPADVFIGGPNEHKKNLVVRLHGTGKQRPVLLIGHLDVVEARREDWSTDPFKLVEKGGFFYGRGTLDIKDGDAIMVTTLLRMKQEGLRPDRDIILALTADEEGGCCNGVDWLLHTHRALIDAGVVLGLDDWTVSPKATHQVFNLSASEKLYADYQLTALNGGGHSSVPRPDNAIYQLIAALQRVAAWRFPLELNNVTRAYIEHAAASAASDRAADLRGLLKTPPDTAAIERLSWDPVYGPLMRTTCVTTRIEGGHANNALPQRATAIVNCRILPGHSREEIRLELMRVLADAKIAVRYMADDGQIFERAPAERGLAPPPLDPEVGKPLQDLVAATWPNAHVVPFMSLGASDAVYTRGAGMPTYQLTGVVAVDPQDARAHGRDERVGVDSFYTANLFFYRYLKAITQGD